MKQIGLLLLLLFSFSPGFATTDPDSLLKVLDQVIRERSIYHSDRQHRIDSLKKELSHTTNDSAHYAIYRGLYEAYRPFRMDSALWVDGQRLAIARKINNPYYINSDSMNIAEILGGAGMYKEALEILDNLDMTHIDRNRRPYYYHIYHSIYTLMTDNAFSEDIRNDYRRLVNDYKDSLLSIQPVGSLGYRTMRAGKELFNGNYREALSDMQACYDEYVEQGLNIASPAYGLAQIYRHLGDKDMERRYLSLSALADLRSGVKEYLSLWKLAHLLFEEGDIDRAYTYMKCSIEDAIFCNARYRAMQISEMLPIVNSAYDIKMKRENTRIRTSLILISALSLILLLAVYLIWAQVKKLSEARRSMRALNEDLRKANEELNHVNIQLRESNQVKEEYIGYVFNMCSSYIDKLEDFRKNLHRKVKTGQIEDIFRITKSSSLVADELKELFRSFDAIFLNLYPNFVKEFNSMLRSEEAIVLKEGELLTPELRIYALVRLGIQDSTKIASFLHYSPQTVYNYRMKVRNKLRISRKEFSDAIHRIGLES
ncbi:MAG: DUF6377 domain-containing protein [Bacteroides sp.]|nr:DUF6377 domain-containing protein [Bacteroides sp.]